MEFVGGVVVEEFFEFLIFWKSAKILFFPSEEIYCSLYCIPENF